MKIFVVVHGYPPTAVAGTEICAARLAAALAARGHDIFVMTREEKPGWPEYKIIRDEVDGIPVLRVVNNFTRLQGRYLFDYHPRVEEIFEGSLSLMKPELVHVQHLAGASWRIPGIVKERGIPLVISLHDYWYPCERVQLLRPDGTLCPGPDDGWNCAIYCARRALSFMASAAIERVRLATGRLTPLPGESLLLSASAAFQRLLLRGRTRRLARVYAGRCERLLRPLARADALVSPSERARTIYTSLGIPADRHVVIPHALPDGKAGAARRARRAFDGRRPLILGYAGNVMAHKGVETLLRAVKTLPPSRVRLKIYGRVYPLRYARFIEKAVRRFPQGQVESHGRYSPDELPDIFAQLDVLVIPTRWHETYNLVLWEAWGAELPVIVSRVGALADVVREGVDGLTFSPGDWRELRAVIERIAEAPGLIEEMRRNLPRVGITIEENVRRYEELFRGVVGP